MAMEILAANDEAVLSSEDPSSQSRGALMDLSSDMDEVIESQGESSSPSSTGRVSSQSDVPSDFPGDLSPPPSQIDSSPLEAPSHLPIPSESSERMETCSVDAPIIAVEVPAVAHDPNDLSRVDLEFVENHKRHAGSNAGPFYLSDMPLVLGRDLFHGRDFHRARGLVSRHHCRIEASWNEEGELEYYVKDTSANGTFLGPHRIDPSGPGALVQHGDVISLLSSHSSPIESYDVEGTGFRVTLGVRWLRPNLPSEPPTPSSTPFENKPQISARTPRPSPFIGILAHQEEEEEAQGSDFAASQHTSSSATPSSSTPGKNTERKEKKNTSASKKKQGTNKAIRRRRARDPSAKNHSGNDTDDTDGDDEMEMPQKAIATPKPTRPRKPIVTVSTPTFEDDAPEQRLAHRDSGKRSPRTKVKIHTKMVEDTLKTPDAKFHGSPDEQSPTGKYWELEPGSSRKRSRNQRNVDSNGNNEEEETDDLASEEPARKVRSN